MRLILKTKSRYINFYWISLQKEQIVGWFAQDYLRKLLSIPHDNHFDSHFTLPKDGNYHFSYKSINVDKEEFINVYYDNVKVKVLSNSTRDVSIIPRSDFELKNPYLATLVPKYRLENFESIKHFQFPLGGFNVYNGDIESKKGERLITENEVTDNDVLVDLSTEHNVNVNVCAFIRQETLQDDFTQGTYKVYKKTTTLSNGRLLELICTVYII